MEALPYPLIVSTKGTVPRHNTESLFHTNGLRLPDNDFWWTVASCRNGAWGFQAYHYPTDRFANVKFAEKLFALDNVGIAINPPRNLEPAELRRDPMGLRPGRGPTADRWMLVVGKDGLRPR